MRFNDLVFAFPALLSAMMITAVFGPGAVNAIIAIGIFNIPVFARVARAGALALWPREFILAARAAGKGQTLITVEHILPNIASLLLVQGDDPVRARRARRGRALLSRARRAAAAAELGPDAVRGPDPDGGRPVARDLPRLRHRRHRARPQSARRRARRRVRSEAEAAPLSLLEIAESARVDRCGADPERRRPQPGRAGKITGPGGRVGLGQIDDRALRDAAAARARPRRRPHHLRRTRSARRQRGRDVRGCAATTSAWCSRSR